MTPAIRALANPKMIPAILAPPVETLIDKLEVARRLNKGARTIDRWMKRRILPFYKTGRSVSFKWSEVEAHLRETCLVRAVGNAEVGTRNAKLGVFSPHPGETRR